MTTEEDRHELYEAARRELGDGPAATPMVRLFAMDPERVATKDDLAELRGEIAELRGELRGEIAQVRLDSARQARQLTLTILIAFSAQLAGMAGVVATLT